jgi:hypothetical protein
MKINTENIAQRFNDDGHPDGPRGPCAVLVFPIRQQAIRVLHGLGVAVSSLGVGVLEIFDEFPESAFVCPLQEHRGETFLQCDYDRCSDFVLVSSVGVGAPSDQYLVDYRRFVSNRPPHSVE